LWDAAQDVWGSALRIRVIAFIKAINDENPWAVTDIEVRFVEDSKGRRKDQSLRLIPKR